MLSLFVIIFFIVTSASSWGPKTNEHICQQAVTKVWGEKAFLNCFVSTRIDEICSLLEEGYREECLRLTVMPWSIPDDVFNDSDKWHDYSLCHISGPPGESLCGDKSFTPAKDEADEWFIRSRNYADECLRMYAFCIGGNYYAKRFFQPYQVILSNAKCEQYFRDKTDENVGSGRDWSVRSKCSYDFWEPRAGRSVWVTLNPSFIVNNNKIDAIVEDLVAEGLNISALIGEIGEHRPAVVSSTSTTSTTVAKTTTSTTTVVKAAASTATVVKVVETSSSTSSSTVYAAPAAEDGGEDAAEAIVIEESKTYSKATFAIVFVVLCVLIFIVFRRLMMESRESQAEEEIEAKPVKKKEDYVLQDIKGLGRVAEDRLKSVGICSLKKLIETDASEISAETEISEERITEWKKKAGDMLK